MPPVVVCIESPLGGGKGFFLKYIRQHVFKHHKVYVDLQDDAISYVMDMNKDSKRWAVFTELDFLLNHVCAISTASKQQCDFAIIEGSPITDKYCYFNDIDVTPVEKKLYDEWFNILKPYWHIDANVYLYSSTHSMFDRIMGNSKKEQAFVTLNYLAHKIALYNKCLANSPRISCEHNFEDNEPVLEVMKDQLFHYMNRLKTRTQYHSISKF